MKRVLSILLLVATISARADEASTAPVQVAASKFGGFFQRLFTGSESSEPEPTTNASTNSTPLDLSRFSKTQLAAAVRQALGQGVTNAVLRLGSAGGFATNQNVRIEMPDRLKSIEAGLRRYGQDAIADRFVGTLNQAAEKAVGVAAPLFHDALKKLTVEDAAGILSGPANAATDYFRKATSADLTKLVKEKVSETTKSVGLTNAYKELTSRLNFGSLFLNYDVEDLDQYVTESTLDGLFKVVAEEEQKIRQDPVARGSQLLQSVFGSVLKR